MKISIALMIMFTMLACRVPYAVAQNGLPGVFATDAASLKKNKARIKSGDELILPAYKALLKEAEKALKSEPVSVMEKKNIPPSGDKHDYMSLAPYHWPDPTKADGLPYIRKDGQTNPEVKDYKDKEYMPRLCADVYSLALAYYFSGEEMYAKHAAKLVRVWFLDTATRMNPNLNFGQAMKGHNTGRGAGMIDTRHFVKLIDGLQLLHGSQSFKDDDKKAMQQWFAEFLNWMQTSKTGRDEMDAENNHGAWYDAQRLSMALFTGNKELAKKIVLNAQDRLDKQMDENGAFPKEMARTISLHYTCFVMEAFFNIAQMAEKTGLDMWSYKSPSGKSLKKGFDTLMPYLVKEKQWTGPQIKDFNYEDGYELLMQGAAHYQCTKCKAAVKMLAADKAERLRINLLY